jgi:iron complex outermembrane receptor protein
VDPASRNTYLLSAFIQDTITVVPDRLHLIVGSKFEDNSYTGFEIQPSARLLWTPDEKTSLWGAVSRAVRTPSRSNEDQDVTIVTQPPIGLPTEFHVGSDHPDSEELLSYEVGVRRQIDKNLSVDVTGFANIYSNLIGTQLQSTTFVPTPTPHILVDRAATNGMSAETYGVEMAAKWQVAPTWQLAGSYSLLTAFVHEYKTDLNPSDSAIEGSYPRNQFQIHSYWDITRKLALNSSLYYVDGIGGGNTQGTPGPPSGSYFRMDVGVTWSHRPGLELTMGIQNAFDPHHREAPFSGNASSEVDRAVYGQLTWRY